MASKVRRSARIAGLPNAPIGENDDGHHDRRSFQETVEAEREDQAMGESQANSRSRPSSRQKPYDTPPTYTIDLSLPPAERYIEVALDFKENLTDLISLFDEVVASLGLSISLETVKRFAKVFLRRVNDSEQTEELRGISKAIGVDMYLLVCFNTLLDLFMGCTSGGVRVGTGDERRMLHFRTLDWGMDVLRKVVVQLEFVEKPNGGVIARSVTYVGFVGMLTGIRPNLSISLNFRGNHNNTASRWANIRYYSNHLAVLLGFRPSIASTLRRFILPGRSSIWGKQSQLPDLAQIRSTFPSTTSTACYVIASDGDTTTIFEKDRATAEARSSSQFVLATNHDVACEVDSSHPIHPTKMHDMIGMDDLIEESMDRKQCIEKKWRKVVTRYCKENPGATENDVSTERRDVQKWMTSYPITNECTHYAVIMDPKKGEIVWTRRWKEPLIPSTQV